MSVLNPNQHDLEQAYYQGLRAMGSIDSEVAEDLGIPTSPEAFRQHVVSGEQSAQVPAPQNAREATRAVDHRYYAAEFRQTGKAPSSDQLAINQTGRAAVNKALADAEAKRG